MIASYFWVGSISYAKKTWLSFIGTIPPIFLIVFANNRYTRFGEVLPFLYFKPLALQGLRIMKFTHLLKNFFKLKAFRHLTIFYLLLYF